jgi:hypothetical protein
MVPVGMSGSGSHTEALGKSERKLERIDGVTCRRAASGQSSAWKTMTWVNRSATACVAFRTNAPEKRWFEEGYQGVTTARVRGRREAVSVAFLDGRLDFMYVNVASPWSGP